MPDAGRACLACGQIATDTLMGMVDAAAGLTCIIDGKDRYQRSLGTCFAGKGLGRVNLQQALIRAGLAVAEYDEAYVPMKVLPVPNAVASGTAALPGQKTGDARYAIAIRRFGTADGDAAHLQVGWPTPTEHPARPCRYRHRYRFQVLPIMEILPMASGRCRSAWRP